MIRLYRITACSDPNDAVQKGYGLRLDGQKDRLVFVTRRNPVKAITNSVAMLDKLKPGNVTLILDTLGETVQEDWMQNKEGMDEYTMTEIPLARPQDVPRGVNPHYIELI